MVNPLECEFLNGSCASLALKFNQLYGYEIYHVFLFNKEGYGLDEEEDTVNGIDHTLVKIGEDKYLDITGVHSASELIKQWYRYIFTTRQTTELFLIDNNIEFKILKDDKIPITSDDKLHYNFQKSLEEVNYEYDGEFDLDDVCNNLIKTLNDTA